MVVLEACVTRREAEPGGNSGVPLEAIWVQYQENENKYVVRSPSKGNTQTRKRN